MEPIVKELIDFIAAAPTSFHAVAQAAEMLKAEGFIPLAESDRWKLVPGGRYYVTRNCSTIAAFTVPLEGWGPAKITASHGDAPGYKIKENGELLIRDQYTVLNTEGYGGMICSSWLDRPLSIAGRVLVRTEQGIEAKLFAIDRDLLLIPSVAIHMNREVNCGYKYNAQVDMLPLYGSAAAKGSLMQQVAEAAGTTPEQIVTSDLLLYNRMLGTVLGADDEFIAAPRMDDLGCVYGTLKGFLQARHEGLCLWCMFDNEEVGSTTKQGACSTFLADLLRRVCTGLGGDHEDYHAALASSLLVSADNAHAVHPNHPEYSDASNPVFLNEGVVIKYNANQKYTTDAVSAALFRTICARAEVPVQTFANRSDLPGGSTLGNLSNTQVSLNAVDIGLPQLAMHSSYETAGTKDLTALVQVSRALYETKLHAVADGCYCL